MKITKILIIVVLIGAGAFILMNRGSDSKIVSPQTASSKEVVATPSPTPTPIPVIFNQSSDLEAETESLTPNDFSNDYKTLKEEAGKI